MGSESSKMERPVLVLCIDRDNDLYEKASVSGPLIGRERNLEGAMALSLADPEDPDSNAIYAAIKAYDSLRKEGKSVEIVTLTGDKSLGYKADRILSGQFDKILSELNPVSCILVSDGASDEEVIPIIKSRLKVDSNIIVFIKQAKELEKTYFVLLEKLKDPYFSRTIIGIPAFILLLTAISYYMGLGWVPIVSIVAAYALLRVYGFEDVLIAIVKDFRISFERASWLGYVGALAIFLVAIFVSIQTFHHSVDLHLSGEKIFASVLASVSWIFLMGIYLMLAGKTIDALMEKRKYAITKYTLYAAAATLATFVIIAGTRWIANLDPPYVDFGTFLGVLVISLFLGYGTARLINWYRLEILSEMKLEGKEAITEQGGYLGKIVGFDAKRGKILIQTVFDRKYALSISAISSVEDKVIVRTKD